MFDYNTIQFEFPLDDFRRQVGVLSYYRRVSERTEEVEIFEPDRHFLGMIMNLSPHTHRYWVGDTSGTLLKHYYNFFSIPASSSRWRLEPGMNAIFCLECDVSFLLQFTNDVAPLEDFLSDASENKLAMLTRLNLALPAEILDSIMEMTREHQFRGKSRDLYLRAKSGNILAAGLLHSQQCYSVAAASVESVQLQRLYQYMVANLQYIVDTRPLMNIIDMPENELREKFRAMFGKSMIEALRYERLKKAEELLLHTTIPIGEVGLMVGYSAASPFIYAFKLQYGIYPKEFRERQAGAAKGK